MKLFCLFVILGFLVAMPSLNAQNLNQQVIATTGSYISTSGYSLSYTVGEPAVQSLISTDGYLLTQGFQQSFDIVTAVGEISHSNQLLVYPNPCDQLLSIKLPDKVRNHKFQISIFDISGKKIQEQEYSQFMGSEVLLNLNFQAVGVYFLSFSCQELNLYKRSKFLKSTSN
jgi:hypothetical protein